jgi:2-dehydropantoate 2-reductase
MGQDMYKGRHTEIDFINGVIAEKGREVGVPSPSHVRLIEAVKLVEQAKSRPIRRICPRSDSCLL